MKSSDIVRSLAPREIDINEEPLTTLLFPARFLGMGLLIAWFCSTHLTGIFPGPFLAPELKTDFDMGLRIGDIGTLLLLAVFSGRLGRLSDHRWIVGAGVCLSVVGVCLVGLVSMPYVPSLTLAFGIMSGIGGAFLFCLWAEVYAQMGQTQALMFGALSLVVAGVASVLMMIIISPVNMVTTALLPAISLACAILSVRILPREKRVSADVHFHPPVTLIGIMCIAGLISGMSGIVLPQIDFVGIGALHRLSATVLAGAVLIVLALVRTDTLDVRFLARVCFPLALVGIVMFMLSPLLGVAGGLVVSFLLKLAYVWFTIFMLLQLANISYRYEVPALKLFAIARALSELGIFLGIITRRTITHYDALSAPFVLEVMGVLGILLVCLCAWLWQREKSVNTDWGAAGIHVGAQQHIAGARERFMARCDDVAEKYGLTEREKEIMALIAERKSRAEIEQQLFLSANTVKTHVRHLYTKLDVHSKAEVIALLEE